MQVQANPYFLVLEDNITVIIGYIPAKVLEKLLVLLAVHNINMKQCSKCKWQLGTYYFKKIFHILMQEVLCQKIAFRGECVTVLLFRQFAVSGRQFS